MRSTSILMKLVVCFSQAAEAQATDLIVLGAERQVSFYTQASPPTRVLDVALTETPISVAVSDDNGIAVAAARDRLYWFDLTTNPISRPVEVPLAIGTSASQVAFSSDRLVLLAQVGAKSYLFSYPFYNARPDRKIELEKYSHRLAVTQGRAFVGSPELKNVREYDLTNGTIVNAFATDLPNAVLAWGAGYCAYSIPKGFVVKDAAGTRTVSYSAGLVDFLAPLGARTYIIDEAARKGAGTDSSTLPNDDPQGGHPWPSFRGRPVGAAPAKSNAYLFVASVRPSGGVVELLKPGSPDDSIIAGFAISVSPTCIATTR